MEETKHSESLPGPAVPETVKAEIDFNKSERRALLIIGLGMATIIGLIIVILGIQAYFDHIREVAVYEKVQVPVSDDLRISVPRKPASLTRINTPTVARASCKFRSAAPWN